ncbi:hypothetical protein P6U18_23530, partial [Pseudomonas sp. L01]|nr:hypothetical protein [Pseudomonas sp. L01]
MATKSKGPYKKFWCFTLNNPLESEFIDEEWTDYQVIGKENAPDTGTPHLQGYICFKKAYYLSGVKKFLGRAHWEPAKGSHEQNYAYCTKDGDFLEKGTMPAPPTANASKKRKADYDLAIEKAKHQKLYEIESGVLIRHMSSLKQIARDHPLPLEEMDYLCGIWLWGPPGTGKSRSARWMFPKAYPKMCNKWWDGYLNEPYVIIDDVDMNHKVLGHHLKIWTDHYPFTAEVKGHSLRIRPEVICVTSNYKIDEIFFEDSTLQQA